MRIKYVREEREQGAMWRTGKQKEMRREKNEWAREEKKGEEGGIEG